LQGHTVGSVAQFLKNLSRVGSVRSGQVRLGVRVRVKGRVVGLSQVRLL
jgi:hypothetical protein